ncbi:TetR/AcrR family transcriptional regulator [Paenarthrobacter sp. CM16]|uniref:TetR/AcrR family transcriptional regulator n=1 Tax=Paenarthrobacter sp. CM16 TaxID=2738447 RepID=UPI00155366E4|nr:TetR/AcrR family transcriptional regulator [Paenarthrobacter sp. CM16]NQD87535.1 TetR/AcrR family transcriptional regulator [Paenarthrobacter sp. CM16]
MPVHDPADVWRRPERSAVGPKPEHSRNGIAAAALRIADEEGLAAVSIRRVATSVGAGAASLYRYVKSHDELVELMMDAVAGEYQFETTDDHPQGRLLNLARQGRSIMHRHPWLAPLLITRPSTGPNSLRFLDGTLAAMEAVDLPGPAKLQVVAMMSAITSAFVQNELASLPPSDPTEGSSADRGSHILDALQSGEYPHLAAAMAGHSGAGSSEEQFTNAITNYLAGAGIPAWR